MDGVRLHVVTGKGGVGKTTVASALALALSRQGKRVLLVEVEGRQGISQTFDVPPLGTEEVRLVAHAGGGELWGLLGRRQGRAARVPADVLQARPRRRGPGADGRHRLRDHHRPGRARRAAHRQGLRGGRPHHGHRAATRARGPGTPSCSTPRPPAGSPASSTSTSQVADLARMGPIHSQAESITRMLRDRQSVVHVVTLLEEMPVQESLDAIGELSDAGLRPRAPSSSTRCASRSSTRCCSRPRPPSREPGGRAGARRPRRRRGARRRQDGERPARRGSRPRRARRARALPDRRGRLPGPAHARPCPRSPSGIEDGGIAVLADELLAQGVR